MIVKKWFHGFGGGTMSGNLSVRASDFAEANPPDFEIPAMICQPEKNFYCWLTSNHATGAGAVVELGTWLGASTAYLSAGMRGKPIYCFDGFKWSELDNWKSGIQLKDGASFRHLFEQNMTDIGARIIVQQAMLDKFSWNAGPVELMIVDLGKTAREVVKLLTTFSPSFVPGRTRIAFQDYQYFPGYQIAIVMDAIRSSASLENVVISPARKQPNTVSFLMTGEVDITALNRVRRGFKRWSSRRIYETWERINDPLPDQAKARLAPGLALHLFDARHKAEAVKKIVELPMDAIMFKRWRRMSTYPAFSARYRDLFSARVEP